MIINTGMRTDIPAFYSEWLMNRIREGFVYTRNPYYRHQVTKYNLDKKVVDCLAFCTKNPAPMLKYIDELKEYSMYWFVTITPYGKNIEPNVPDKLKVIESFKELSDKIGSKRVALRYDPIFIGEGFNVERHIKAFEKILGMLKGYTYDCTISFLDMYEKVKRNTQGIRPPNIEEQKIIATEFARIGKENNMTVHACLENEFLNKYGIDCTGCMSKQIVERAINTKLSPPKEKNVRAKCDCLLGRDIGAYNTCGHLCKYCYANIDSKTVKENMKKHIKTSPFLIGDIEEGDVITEAKQKSWKLNKTNNQISFFEKV